MFEADPKSVFLNVPYDKPYEPLFATLVGTLVSLGQKPHCVLEVRERGQGRLVRIYELLRSCGVSIHDLSRAGRVARYNMPFELGLACSFALDGKPHEVLVLDTISYRLDRTLSDYKGRDPLLYHGRVDGLVDCLADVFQTGPGPSPDVLKEEARILRKSAREIVKKYGGSLFRPAAFRALVAASIEQARSHGLIQ
ncbi:MAG TPA: hypothetical protein VGS22_12935 [Thermoanaerobaculia bacterium]|jgi:hypothetical protein|nr:hypothetical protein [Thermoanaerobaculia bacterium]